MENNNTKIIFRRRLCYGDSLWIYRNGFLMEHIGIDNTYDAIYWCNRKGMAVREVVTADNGNRYAIWTNDNLVCALPVRNEVPA